MNATATVLLGVLLLGCGEDDAPSDAARPGDTDVAETSVEVGETTSEAGDADDARDGETAVEIDIEEEPVYIPLVDAHAWALVPEERDPFFTQRPEGTVCAPEGLVTEAGTLEINTGLCDWPTVEQPLLAPIAATDELEIIFFFGPLIAPEAGEAIIELRFGDDLIWEQTFAIPSTGGFIPKYVTPPRAYELGEMVTFHLHNHGANTWNLASISILGSE